MGHRHNRGAMLREGTKKLALPIRLWCSLCTLVVSPQINPWHAWRVAAWKRTRLGEASRRDGEGTKGRASDAALVGNHR